jgi:hypothetical protein
MRFSGTLFYLWSFVAFTLASGCQVHIKTPPSVSGTSLLATILSVVPPSSTTAGGEMITITGEGFAPGATVTIGGLNCLSTDVISSTEIQCTVPPHAVASLPLLVTNPGQQAATGSFLYYLAAQAAPNFTTNLGGGPTVGHAGGLGVSAISAIGESAQAKPQSAVGISAKTGIVGVTTSTQ